MLQHISPRTTIFYIWDHITLQSASVPPFHTTTSRLKHMPFHITQTVHILHGSPFHIHNYSTPHHTTPTFNITAYFTRHHIPHRITPHQIPYRITPPHLTSQHITSFSTYMTSHYNRTAHCISPQFHTTTDFPHLALWQPFHIPEHHIPHAIVHTFCISISRTMSEIATFNIAPHFTYTDVTSHQIAPPHLGTPFHITPCTHHHIRI